MSSDEIEYDLTMATTVPAVRAVITSLHPTVKAYQVWADALKPVLTELLGPPVAEDHAPLPTGNPGAAR